MKTLEERDNKLLKKEDSYSRTYYVSKIIFYLHIFTIFASILSGQKLEDRFVNTILCSTALWFSVFQYTKARIQHIESIRHYLNS
jgi:hypothetical protein